MDAREAALLTEYLRAAGGWSDGALKKQLAAAGLDGREAALATQLCFGCSRTSCFWTLSWKIFQYPLEADGG
ncbi:MAG: hypothetical protein ACLSUM_10680 [Dysosmobacter welbionis]